MALLDWTGSIDAALVLIEKMLPHWTAWELRTRAAKRRFHFEMSKMDEYDSEVSAIGRSSTAPLAILDALLTALIEQEGKHP